MKTFTIENETNNITSYTNQKEADAVAAAERFASQAALLKLATSWPPARLVDIWNSLPCASPVTKFKDRKTAVARIWNAIQSLGEPIGTGTKRKIVKSVPGKRPQPQPKAKTMSKANSARQSSKTDTILKLLKRPEGAGLTEIMKATEWQAHSVRGFISGTLRKKMSLPVVSSKSVGGERHYSIEA